MQGDGGGRGTHISIFFVIVNSEYEELLQWPMRKQVIIQLVNLRNEAGMLLRHFLATQDHLVFNDRLKISALISMEQFLDRVF